MTKASKKRQVLRAAELIASGKEEYCCIALGYNSEVAKDFTTFYRINVGSSFFGLYWAYAIGQALPTNAEKREIRVLALLWFMEAGL